MCGLVYALNHHSGALGIAYVLCVLFVQALVPNQYLEPVYIMLSEC